VNAGQQTEGASISTTVGEPRLTAERHGQPLVIVAHPKPGIGEVITDPNSTRFIPGVEEETFV